MRTKQNTEQNQAIGVVPTAPWRIREIKALPDFCIDVVFIDGLRGRIDLSQYIISPRAGVFACLQDQNLFNQAFLNYGALTWPGEIDLAPDAMYEEIREKGTWVL